MNKLPNSKVIEKIEILPQKRKKKKRTKKKLEEVESIHDKFCQHISFEKDVRCPRVISTTSLQTRTVSTRKNGLHLLIL